MKFTGPSHDFILNDVLFTHSVCKSDASVEMLLDSFIELVTNVCETSGNPKTELRTANGILILQVSKRILKRRGVIKPKEMK